ncbi:MAG: WecB/TagA/CpsF family glycosyltransferase [Anaerolineaceae bacterium]|nr:WecB/TagA/CpsF family glycosyltransferase [Anaerolineaceae bacterium]
MRSLVVLLGVPIDNLNLEETIDQIDRLVQNGRSLGKYHQVVTVNADFVVKAANDPELRYLLHESDLATADGMPLVWAARLLNVPLKERVTGADMVPSLAERAAQKGYSLYLFGAAPGIAKKAGEILQEWYPGLKIAGVASPALSSVLEQDPAVLADIENAHPDILMVALGNPKQEKWIGMYGRQLKVPVMIGVGASLDFIAGQVKRAPQWMQKTGFEWLFRLLQEPRRLWRRYVVDLVAFSNFFVRQWWVMRGDNSPPITLPATELVLVDQKAILRVKGRLVLANTKELLKMGQQALARTPNLLVNLAEVDFMDSSGIGALVNLAKQARDAGGDLSLVAAPAQILRTISLLRLDKFFRIFPDILSAIKAKPVESTTAENILQTTTQVIYPISPTETSSSNNQAESATWTKVNGPLRFDAASSPQFKTTCSSLLNENPFLVLDLRETEILASAGLAVLAHLHKLALEKKGKLRITNCSKEVLQTIRMVRMDKFLEITQETAQEYASGYN